MNRIRAARQARGFTPERTRNALRRFGTHHPRSGKGQPVPPSHQASTPARIRRAVGSARGVLQSARPYGAPRSARQRSQRIDATRASQEQAHPLRTKAPAANRTLRLVALVLVDRLKFPGRRPRKLRELRGPIPDSRSCGVPAKVPSVRVLR